MNSIAIIIILMISLIGIGSLFWMRNYYNITTRKVDKEKLRNSITNILTSREETDDYDNSLSTSFTATSTSFKPASLGENNEKKNYFDSFSRLNEGSNNITNSIKGLFNNQDSNESRLDSLKSAINDTFNRDNNESSESITPLQTSKARISPTFVNISSEEEVIEPYTYNAEENSPTEKPPIIPETNINTEEDKTEETNTTIETTEPENKVENDTETLETNTTPEVETNETLETETEDSESDVIYTENALNNDKFVSAEDEVQEAIDKTEPAQESDGLNIITPIHTQQDKEILELYDDNETMTPYDNFEYKDTDQKRIENASNRIDKFYERLSEISINKITGKNKENTDNDTKSLSKTDNSYTQTVFKTEPENNKLSNETIVPYTHEEDNDIISEDIDTITPISAQRTLNRRVGLQLQTRINNKEVTLKAGDTVIFNHNNETYSSIIMDVRPDEVYVNYRRSRIWISPDSIKKKLE